jgi:NAD(P)-dependent dehydrogenase (short-subunit alcohol dehydrogenase family)
VAVVTGAANGIGQACARRFAEEGANIVAADIQEDRLADTVALVEEVGQRCEPVGLDAASALDNETMAATAVDTFGRLDVVLTAAGITHASYDSGDVENDLKSYARMADFIEEPARAFPGVDLEDWHKVIEVNLTGTLMAMQACSNRMLDLGNGGSIITIASIASKDPDAGPLAYTVSKAGVWMLTKKAARMLASGQIRVNAIGPGFIETNMIKAVDLLPEEAGAQAMWDAIPLGRRGQPIDIANAALFLASDEASYFTGEILHPDGGYYTE